MPKVLASSVCLAALLLAGSAIAAPASPTTVVAPLTVQGASPQTIAKETRAFVQKISIAPNPEIGQISRWHTPVCVEVQGLASAQAAQIKTRIEEVAKSVGLPAPWGGAACKTNVQIVFSDTPQAVMDDVAKRREDLLGYYHRSERDRLKTVSRPIQAWYKTATAGGKPGGEADLAFANYISDDYISDLPVVGRTLGPMKTDDPDQSAPSGCGDAPQFTACLTSLFQGVFIVVDTKALQAKGIGVGVASDYLALLALSQPKALDGCADLASVLDLTAKSPCPSREAPDGLTPADAAWLTALYQSDPQAKGDSERTEIASRMADILIKANMPAGGR